MLSIAAAFSTSAVEVTSVASESFTELGWARAGASKPTDKVGFTLNLKTRNVAELKRRALAASTPGTAEYGKFMSVAEIDDLTSPSPDAVNRVKSWLADSGIEHKVVRENIFVHTSVEKASSLLGTSFSTYRMDGRALTKAGNFSLPAEVAEVLHTTLGLHGMPAPRNNPITMAKAGGATPPAVTPAVIASTYNIKKPYVNLEGTQVQGVAEFQGQYMNKADLVSFFDNEVPGFKSGEDDVSKFVGAAYKQGTGVEADLDIQFIMGNAPGVKTDFFEWPECAAVPPSPKSSSFPLSLFPLLPALPPSFPLPSAGLFPFSPLPCSSPPSPPHAHPPSPYHHNHPPPSHLPRRIAQARLLLGPGLVHVGAARLELDCQLDLVRLPGQPGAAQLQDDRRHRRRQQLGEGASPSPLPPSPLPHALTHTHTAPPSRLTAHSPSRLALQLAAKGVSVMISSGDSGSGYTKSGLSGYKLYPCAAPPPHPSTNPHRKIRSYPPTLLPEQPGAANPHTLGQPPPSLHEQVVAGVVAVGDRRRRHVLHRPDDRQRRDGLVAGASTPPRMPFRCFSPSM